MATGDRGCSDSGRHHAVPDGGLNAGDALELATNKEHADIIADIVGHPAGAPSVEELSYTNPALDRATIRRHLSSLASRGVVSKRPLDQDVQCEEPPEAWYEITDAARDLFDHEGLFPDSAWQREYGAITKTDRIQTLEQLPR